VELARPPMRAAASPCSTRCSLVVRLEPARMVPDWTTSCSGLGIVSCGMACSANSSPSGLVGSIFCTSGEWDSSHMTLARELIAKMWHTTRWLCVPLTLASGAEYCLFMANRLVGGASVAWITAWLSPRKMHSSTPAQPSRKRNMRSTPAGPVPLRMLEILKRPIQAKSGTPIRAQKWTSASRFSTRTPNRLLCSLPFFAIPRWSKVPRGR
jgi:hypothetical protein